MNIEFNIFLFLFVGQQAAMTFLSQVKQLALLPLSLHNRERERGRNFVSEVWRMKNVAGCSSNVSVLFISSPLLLHILLLDDPNAQLWSAIDK